MEHRHRNGGESSEVGRVAAPALALCIASTAALVCVEIVGEEAEVVKTSGLLAQGRYAANMP